MSTQEDISKYNHTTMNLVTFLAYRLAILCEKLESQFQRYRPCTLPNLVHNNVVNENKHNLQDPFHEEEHMLWYLHINYIYLQSLLGYVQRHIQTFHLYLHLFFLLLTYCPRNTTHLLHCYMAPPYL